MRISPYHYRERIRGNIDRLIESYSINGETAGTKYKGVITGQPLFFIFIHEQFVNLCAFPTKFL